MTKKKIIPILALFLVLFIAVGAASAADDIAVNDVNDGSDMGVAVLNGGDAGQVNGTFADLQSIIDGNESGATIELEKNYVYTDASEDVYGIVIDKPLTIDGKGFVLDGKSTSRIFYVSSSNVVIKNIKFVNGFTTMPGQYGAYYKGAGILFNGPLSNCTVENCSFKDIHADIYGAIGYDNYCTDCYVKDSYFNNCYTVKSSGGAIGYGYQCTGNYITNCVFENCYADSSNGGALCTSGATVTNCNFTNCHASKGGAISLEKGAKLVGCNFNNCHSTSMGGAIVVSYGGNSSIDNCNFTDCKVTGYGYGGGIGMSYGSEVNVTNCNFSRCTATSGGAYYDSYGYSGFENDNKIESCSFYDCVASSSGDAIYTSRMDNTISKSVFINDGVASKSAIFEIAGQKVVLEDCIFDTVEGYAAICRDQTSSTFVVKDTYFNGKEPVEGVDIKSTGSSVHGDVKVNNYVTLEITVDGDKLNFAFKSNDSSVVAMPNYAVTVEVIAGNETISQSVIISENTGSYEIPEKCDKVTVKSAEGNELNEFGPETVYISATGDDANNGSEEAPVATLGKALKLVVKGGSIIFLDDTFVINEVVVDKPVTIAGKNDVVLDGNNAVTHLFKVENGVAFGLTNVKLTGCTDAPIDATAGNNAVVLDAVGYGGSNVFVTLGEGSDLTANNCVAPNSSINYVTGANIVNPVVVIGATEDNKVYNLNATVTVGNIPVNGLGFKFTATYADGSSEPIAIATAKEGANGVYYLNGTDFGGKTGKIIVGANLANADVTTATVNRVPGIMVEKNYNVTKGDVVPVVVIVDGFTDPATVHLWAQSIPYTVTFDKMVKGDDGKYYYTFNVSTAGYSGKEMALTARLSTVDAFGETVYIATDSTKKITLNDPVPVLSNVTVTGNYSDKVTITFTVINGTNGDKVVLHLIDGSNVTGTVADGQVVFTNVELAFAGIYNTDAIYMRNGETLTTAQVTWNVAKLDTNISFTPETVTGVATGENTVTVTVKDAYGNVVKQGKIKVTGTDGVTLDHNDGIYELVDGVATVKFTYPKAGDYQLKVEYLGGLDTNNTDNYNLSTKDLTVIIDQSQVIVTVDTESRTVSGKVNETITITGTVKDQYGHAAKGNVTIDVNGETFTAVVGEDGTYSLSFNSTESGKWTNVPVKFVSDEPDVWDDTTSVAPDVVKITINKLHTNIVSNYTFIGDTAFNGTYGQKLVLNFTVFDENGKPVEDGNLTLWFNGNAYTVEVIGGYASVVSDDFVWTSTGLYNYVVDYTNNGKVYYDSFNFTNVNIPKIATKVVIDKNVTESTVEGGQVTITFTVTDVDGKVPVTKGVIYYVTPDGIEHSVDVVNGVATVTINVNRTGTYYIAASYYDLTGDFLYSEADFTWDVQLTTTLVTVNNIDGNLLATVKVVDDLGNKVTGNVDLFVNGKLMSLDVVNGVGSVNLGAYNGPVELNAVFTGADGLVSSDSVIVELAAIPENGPTSSEGLASAKDVKADNETAPEVDNETAPEVDNESAPDSGVEEAPASGIPMQHTAIPVFALLALLALPFCYRRD